jgi:uncharacterized alpha-E superfamily protein
MLSRVADSLYWMSCYIERAENVARFIDVNVHLTLDLPRVATAGPAVEQWEPLVATTGDHELFAKRYGPATRASTIKFLAFDTENPNSILSCLRSARENARAVRQSISLEMWEQLNKFYLTMNSPVVAQRAIVAPHEVFSDIMLGSQLFLGITDTTMSHGEGWHFCRLGRMLERADKTSRILDVKYFMLLPSVAHVGTPYEDILWAAVLRSTSALEMYRKRHHQISPERVVDFLVLDREFPRAIHHSAIEAEESLRAISGTPSRTFQNPAEQRLGRLRSELDYLQVSEIIGTGLHEFLDGIQDKLNAAGQAIFESFFALRPLDGTASASTSTNVMRGVQEA